MKFLADEGVDRPIVVSMRMAGLDVQYILETNPGTDDVTILELAYSQNQILITQDKDFGELVFRLKQPNHGVVLIRLEGYSPQFKGEIVIKFLKQYQNQLLNAFTVIQPNVIRIRK